MMYAVLAWAASAVILSACGESDTIEDVCRADVADIVRHTDCLAARELARRDSDALVVSQQDLDYYLDIYRRGFEPLTAYLGAPPIPSSWSPNLIATTTAPQFAEPWLRGDTRTGDANVDDVLSAARIDRVVALGMMPGPYFSLASSTHAVVNRNVAAALQGIPDLQVSAASARLPEGAGFADAFVDHAAERGDAEIVYRLGWGDCFVECAGQVSWRVRVTATGATLLASWVWGKPPPPRVLERWQQPNPER